LTAARRIRRWCLGLAAALAAPAGPAVAGPPYQTDDPEPTELKHWEIYGFVTADGRRSNFDGATGFDLNYGPVADVQLTATLPVAFSHSRPDGWRAGAGDVELGVKYRFFRDAAASVQAAIFPRVILPTSTNGLGGKKTRLLLPLWLQKDFGPTSLFGGGGYEINPGLGNRDFWVAGLALTHDFSDRLSIGTELSYQTRDVVGGASATGVNVGLIRKLGGPFSLLLAGGPSFSGGQTSYHSYLALALNY
jgi:hypothetical protein